ncbi:MAG: type I-E CRISPR-associated protein Cse2/CasB [Methanomassiliicoccales archaeon]|nr:MAG: type I-E CRISPR-associated protein Cse2/CasB [Methanomassiliicoccales archaeon]
MEKKFKDERLLFVDFLISLKEQEKRSHLATLRKGTKGNPENMPQLYPIILPQLPPGMSKWREKVYFEIAALFSMHPEISDHGNLGNTFRELQQKKESMNIEKRFVAILRAHKDDLYGRLRQAISLAKSEDIGINWLQLLEDLENWNDRDSYVQKNWAKSFWGNASSY